MNTVQKFLVLVVVVALIWVGYYFLSYQKMVAEIGQLEEEYQATLQNYQTKKKIADDLPRFEAEVQQLREELEESLTQLPHERKIPALVDEIYDIAKGAGVDIMRLSPAGEIVRGFYAEILISLDLQGGYHNLAVFFDKLGKLDRIVNIAQLSLSSPRTTERGVVLTANCNLITYRFMGGEVKPAGGGPSKKGRKGRT